MQPWPFARFLIGTDMSHLLSPIDADRVRIYDTQPVSPLREAIGVRVRWAPSRPVAAIVFPVHRMVRDYSDYRALFAWRPA
jgi:hypothetical protein